MNKPIYAVWKYDSYPYLLVGEIEANAEGDLIGSDGSVKIKGYNSYRFIPVKILNAEQGKELKAQLENLKVIRDKQTEALNDKFIVYLNDIQKRFKLPITKKGEELA